MPIEAEIRRRMPLSRVLSKLPILAWACLTVSFISLACSSSSDQSASPETLEMGQGIFTANCAICHGAGGEGQPDWHIRKEDGTLPAPPLNGEGHTWHHADGLLYRIVSQGGAIFEDPSIPGFKSAMPAFGETLTREEIISVLTYIKSLWGDKVKRDLSIRESQALASEDDPFP